MDPVNPARIDNNIPVQLSFRLKFKEAVHAFFKQSLVVKLFTYLPAIGPFEKYKRLAELITKCHQVFDKSTSSSMEVKLYGGDTLKSLQSLENRLNKPKDVMTAIRFSSEDSLQAARTVRRMYAKMDNSRVAILNLANRWQPGGVGLAPYGGSQEEFLVRRSNLAWGLDPKFPQGRELHRHLHDVRSQEGYAPQEPFAHHIPYFGAVMSKNVTFIDKQEPEHFDVISAAAPDMRRGSDEDRFLQKLGVHAKEARRHIVKDKIRAVFATALAENVDHLVLGAFGCGCFQNDSAEVAEIFSEVLRSPRYKGKFRSITFAITEKAKLEIFQKVIAKG